MEHPRPHLWGTASAVSETGPRIGLVEASASVHYVLRVVVRHYTPVAVELEVDGQIGADYRRCGEEAHRNLRRMENPRIVATELGPLSRT